MPTIYILGLNAQTRELVIVLPEPAIASPDMMVLLAKELFATTIVMIEALAGPRSILLPKLVVSILILGIP